MFICVILYDIGECLYCLCF